MRDSIRSTTAAARLFASHALRMALLWIDLLLPAPSPGKSSSRKLDRASEGLGEHSHRQHRVCSHATSASRLPHGCRRTLPVSGDACFPCPTPSRSHSLLFRLRRFRSDHFDGLRRHARHNRRYGRQAQFVHHVPVALDELQPLPLIVCEAILRLRIFALM